jgi:putative ABC transport system permease protein
MSEKLTLLVNGGIEYYGTRISVLDGKSQGLFSMPQPILVNKVDEITRVEGVKSAYATIGIMKDSDATMTIGTPPMITAADVAINKDETFELKYKDGRAITAEDRNVAVLGSDLANTDHKHVGDTITLKGREFTVVGILEKTLTAPDNSVSIALADAQELYFNDIPVAFRAGIKASQIANGITVFVKDGFNADQVTEKINQQVGDVKAFAPDEFKKTIKNSMAIFNVIILGSALVAVLVGGFSIINTMSMAIIERTKEIGIKKAIGASNKSIISEIVVEAALMGLIGGVFGTVLGSVTVLGINAVTRRTGQVVFLTTPRLAIASIIFAVFIGAVAGLYPAWYASRLHPIKALRSE